MKKSILLCVLVQSVNLVAQESVGSAEAKSVIITAFSSAVDNNEVEYQKCLYNMNLLKTLVSMAHPYNKDEENKVDELLQIEFVKYQEEQSQHYQAIRAKIKEFNITSDNIVIDSISFSTSKTEFAPTNATLHFKKKDHSAFYKTNVKGLILHAGKYYLETLYLPHIYLGAKNRLLTSAIKQQYIDSCVSRINYLIHLTKSATTKALYGDCLPCYCHKEYISESEQTEGAATIRKKISVNSRDLIEKVR